MEQKNEVRFWSRQNKKSNTLLTGSEGGTHQESNHLLGDFDRGLLFNPLLLLVEGSLIADSVDVSPNPCLLELADDGPHEVLLWGAATLAHVPAFGHVLEEGPVAIELLPKVLERELWPSWHLDVGDLGFEKKLLLAHHKVLEEAERGVLKLGKVPQLMKRNVWSKC